ncbi:hypothetical protein M0812_11260 [Anaeramoeba flamelloides]|uniref:t-SNARE coiled-coil homology domain-containing protein n=1 Tax=Anaeramoeba flamelloides TaxID=1746091 RepID=A0AAV7ZXP7_9EUKA|nr:hypothetical protein M0812_11260 [Anaeramoeba flamelloides]
MNKSEKWLHGFDKLERLISNSNSLLNKKKQKQKQSLNASDISMQLRKNIMQIKKDFAWLEKQLDILSSSPAEYGISNRELMRRQDNLATLKNSVDKLNKGMSNKPRSRGGQLKYDEQGDFIEDEETIGMTNREIYNQQSTLIEKQDESLDLLHGALHRQLEMGKVINNELNEQDKLIDDIDEKMDRVDGKLKKNTKRTSRLTKKTRNRTYICCICWLIIIIVLLVVLASKGYLSGKK